MALDDTRFPHSRKTAMWAGIGATATGTAVLFGWFFHIDFLKGLWPGLSTMKANTALAFALSGIALLLSISGRLRISQRILAVAVGALAGATLLETFTGASWGIDQLLVTDTALAVTPATPGRMGQNTAAAFVTIATALFLANHPSLASRTISQLAAILTTAIGAVGLIGYVYSGDLFYGLASYTQMAIHSALTFAYLGIGVAVLHPEIGVVGVITSNGPGGMLTRRLLPAVFLAPFVIGWLHLLAARAGRYAPELGVAIVIVAVPIVLAAFLLIYANRIDRLDEERQTAEHEVRAGAERMRIALDAARMGIWELDLDTNRVAWSEQMPAVFGIPSDQAPADSERFLRLIHPDDRSRLETAVRQARAGEREHGFEFRTLCADGTTHWIYARAESIADGNGRPARITGVAADVTERKVLEEQLRQAQKLEAVGQLAGGVAHDFNNVLTAIIGYSDMVLAEMKPHVPVRADIEEIRRAGERASAITQQLLAFSRRQVLQPRVLDINRLVEGVETMLRRLIPEHITLLRQLEPGIGCVKADPTQVEQILVNLAVNARDAMPQGGQLTFETANVAVDGEDQRAHAPAIAGDYVVLSVIDTGTGMDRETQEHIFEPFFTTKGPGKGTGLGLATVYGIVRQSGGHVTVDSELNHGTTFKVYLPRVYDAVNVPASGSDGATSHQGGRETILVVEDEAGVRSLTRRILARLGYHVIEAAAPAEALVRARSHQGRIDLLLSDVVMPGSGSVLLFEQLAQEHNEVKVLYMSGYADDTVIHQGLLTEGVPFLQKPFTVQALADKVREVLDRNAA